MSVLALLLFTSAGFPGQSTNLESVENSRQAPPTRLQLGRAFSSNAVLQCEQPCPVFGVDSPGTRIEVRFAGHVLSTVTDLAGRWRVNLPRMSANRSPQTLHVSGTTEITLTNILVGDVWLISGQSNADLPLKSASGGETAIKEATNTYIRILHMDEAPKSGARPWTASEISKLNSEEYFTGSWRVSQPAAVRSVSAIGYFFARNIQTNRDVPIGLIDCTVGGTMAVSWMPPETIEWDARLRELSANFPDSEMIPPFVKCRVQQNLTEWISKGRPGPMPDHPYKPGVCWKNGLASIAPAALRGILWYQGETDTDFTSTFDFDLIERWHIDTFKALVGSWRRAWENPELPVFFVQLPQMNRPSWPWFRESQLKCAQIIHGTAMAVAFDHGNPDNVHPTAKLPVAERLALIARAKSYGENVEWSGPLLRDWKIDGDSIVLRFDHAASGLVSSDGQPLRLFAIAGIDRRFFNASATISNASVIVSAQDVAHPVAVRYAWTPSGSINFFNGAGLPASPFRTDAWITTNHPVRVACIGDSITFGFGITNKSMTYPAQLQSLLGSDYLVQNFGRSGCTVTRDTVYRGWCRGYVRQIEHTNALAFHPDIVICNLGVNDTSDYANTNRQYFIRDYQEILAAYRALPTSPRVILWHPLAPLFPGHAYFGKPVVGQVNDLVKEVANHTGADVIDMTADLVGHPEWFADHIHPDTAGTRRIAEVIHRFLVKTVEPGDSPRPVSAR